MKMIAVEWETERLVMRDAVPDDAARLLEINNALAYVNQWDETFAIQPIDVLVELVAKSVSQSEADMQFRLQPIRLRDDGETIGYFHLHHRLPHPHVVFISMMMIDPAYQKKGYATEVAHGIAGQLRALGDYSAIWLIVYLKNWPAFHCWFKAGFDRIVEWRGDTVMLPGSIAKLVLERRL
jgi:ribosomal protein S18 acetylase RimI-like enzyme